MKKMKIFIAVLLVFSLLPAIYGYAEESTEEIAISQTEEFIKLESFGLISANDEVVFSDNVSRGAFMYHVMKACFGLEEYSRALEGVFSDVTSSTLGAKEIVFAKDFGIISGGDKFRPEDNITYQEAAKIFLTVLGYGEIAESSGGFASGYMMTANKLKIFRDCKFTQEGYIPVREFFKAYLNVLETEVLDMESIAKRYDGYFKTYSRTEDKTLLQHVLGIYKGEGIVESNKYTSITGLSEVDEDRVKIGNGVYQNNGTPASELLGYNTEFYYRYDENNIEKELLYIDPHNNNVIETISENIVKEAVTTSSFKYYVDGAGRKSETVKIPKSATLIYNGNRKKLTALDLCPAVGSVKLIDNDRDNQYDVIHVMNYRTILVSGVSEQTYTVSDLLGGSSLVLDPEDKNYDVIIYKDGVKADFSAITSRCVISYAEPSTEKKNVKYIIVSTKTAEGKLDSISDKKISIDGVDYFATDDLRTTIKLGEYGIYYLDYEGRVVAKKATNDVVYGYLNDIELGFLNNVNMQIFTENNRWVELNLNKDIRFNGKKEKAKVVYEKFMEMDDFRQLITYTVDEEGLINMIKLAESFQAYSSAEENAIEQNIFRVYPEISSATYRSALKSLDNLLVLSGETKVFMIPDQSEGSVPEEEFYMLNVNELHAGDSFENITPYDLDRSRTAGALVMVGNTRKVYSKSSFVVIDSVIYAPNSREEWVKGIKGYYKNTLIKLTAESDSIYDGLPDGGLSPGDVVQIAMNEDGDISKLVLRYDLSEDFNDYFVLNGLYSSNTFLADIIYYVDTEKGKIITEGDGQKFIMGTDGNTTVSIYDTEEKILIEGTIADLEKGSCFIAMVTDYVADEIIVYR